MTKKMTQEEKERIAAAVKEARMLAGMSQEDFGKAFGVSQQAVGQWEDGETKPNPSRLRRIMQLKDGAQINKDMLPVSQSLLSEHEMFVDIVSSPYPIYKTALITSVRAFHKAIQGEREMVDVKQELSSVNGRLARLEDMFASFMEVFAKRENQAPLSA